MIILNLFKNASISSCYTYSFVAFLISLLILIFIVLIVKDMVTQEIRIRELEMLCAQLKEQKSSEYERVQEILQVSIINFKKFIKSFAYIL